MALRFTHWHERESSSECPKASLLTVTDKLFAVVSAASFHVSVEFLCFRLLFSLLMITAFLSFIYVDTPWYTRQNTVSALSVCQLCQYVFVTSFSVNNLHSLQHLTPVLTCLDQLPETPCLLWISCRQLRPSASLSPWWRSCIFRFSLSWR